MPSGQTAFIGRGQEQWAAPTREGYAGQPAPVYTPRQGPAQPGSGASQQQTYQAGDATPHAAWSTTPGTKGSSSSSGGAAAVVALAVAVLAALTYAGWAFTARRGVFADFADGSSVSAGAAKSNDRIDTVLLIVAGVLVLVALGSWVARLVARSTKGGGLDMGGLAVAMLGVMTALVGLFLTSGIADADGQAAQGGKGVTASLVLGGGFVLLAFGLMVGIYTVRGRATDSSGSNDQPGGPGYQNW